MIEQGEAAADEAVRPFLHLCLRGRWDRTALQAARTLTTHGDLDWAALREVAHTEGLAPLLYPIVRGQNLVPRPVERDLRRFYYTNALRNNRLLRALEDVLCHLAAEGVAVILLKGAGMAKAVYGNVAVRPMFDLDLLVPAAEVERARTVLAGLNYSMLSSEPWAGFSQRYGHAMAYRRLSDGKKRPFHVDLHWGLLNAPYYGHILVEDWFARAQPARVAGVEALVPAPEDHLVYLCGHLALHHRYDPALFRYYDMAVLIHHTDDVLDWDAVVQRAVGWRLVIPLQRTLARLQEFWPQTVPASVAQEVAGLQPTRAERWIHKWVVDRRRNSTSDVLLSLATMPRLTRRVRFFLEQALPSRAYMRQRYCPRRPGLWPLAYLQRAGLGLRYLLQGLR